MISGVLRFFPPKSLRKNEKIDKPKKKVKRTEKPDVNNYSAVAVNNRFDSNKFIACDKVFLYFRFSSFL